MDLVLLVISSLFLALFVLLDIEPLRLVLGLPFILFAPGYTLIAALFPKKDSLSRIERITLSFILSMAVVPVIGLLLNYTRLGLNIYGILFSTLFFTFAMIFIAYYRRRRMPSDERFAPVLNLRISSLTGWWRGQKTWDRTLTIVLSALIFVGAGSLAYLMILHNTPERFTEFFALNAAREVGDYPDQLFTGEEGEVILVIVNQEQERLNYRVDVIANGEKLKEIGPVTLNDKERKEVSVSFSFAEASAHQKVEFLLYIEGEEKPYHTLYLWVDVQSSA